MQEIGALLARFRFPAFLTFLGCAVGIDFLFDLPFRTRRGNGPHSPF